MKREIIIFTLLSIIAKIIAFGRELILAYCYGTSVISDVYLLAMTIPVTLFGFISVGITSGFVPIFVEVKNGKGHEPALNFTNRILNILLVICLGMVCIYYVFSEQLIRIMASGFSETALEMSVGFVNISIWAIIFTCITTVLTAYLQINDRLRVTALVSIPLNIGIIFSIFLADITENTDFLPLGYLVSTVLQALYLMYFAYKENYCYKAVWNFKDSYIIKFLKNIALLTISSSTQQINILIDRTLATKIAIGGLSVFEYGSRINDLVMGLTIIPISTAFFPEMSKHGSDISKLKEKIREGLEIFLLIIIPLSAIVLMYSRSIVRIIYFRGAFNNESLNLTTQVVFYYGLGLLAYAIRELFSKVFYALSDAKTPMRNSTVGIVINIILNLILARKMGIGGLALATSISAWLTSILLYFALKKKIGKFEIEKMSRNILKITSCTVVASVFSVLFYQYINKISMVELINLGIAVLVFVSVYLLGICKMGIINIKGIFAFITKR